VPDHLEFVLLRAREHRVGNLVRLGVAK
jgi:hypothetical protein